MQFKLAEHPSVDPERSPEAEPRESERCWRLRESAKSALGAIEQSGANMERLAGAALSAELPFPAKCGGHFHR